jgi:hypothetical protein
MINIVKKCNIQQLLHISFSILIATFILLFVLLFYNTMNLVTGQVNKNTYSFLNSLNRNIDSFACQMSNTIFSICDDPEFKYQVRAFPNSDILQQLEIEDYINNYLSSYFKNRPEIINTNVFISNKKYKGGLHNAVYSLEDTQRLAWFEKIKDVTSVLLPTNIIETERLPGSLNVNVMTFASKIMSDENYFGVFMRRCFGRLYIQ